MVKGLARNTRIVPEVPGAPPGGLTSSWRQGAGPSAWLTRGREAGGHQSPDDDTLAC